MFSHYDALARFRRKSVGFQVEGTFGYRDDFMNWLTTSLQEIARASFSP